MKVLAINGNFDDCQSFVKEFFNSNKDLSLSSANSINIARLAPQIVYYYYSYINLLKNKEINDNDLINFDVPTGNFGNIFAGYYAKCMGLPINSLICASNKNNVLTDYFLNGKYNKNRPFYKTNSPSMDILISSNLERFIYYASSCDCKKTKELMESLKKNGEYDFNNPFEYFYAYSCNEENTLKVIKEVYDNYNYLIDPHTSVAYSAYKEYEKATNDFRPTVVVSTASPYKFPQSVLEAFDIHEADALKAIKVLSDRFNLPIPSVLNYPEVKRTVVELNKAEEYVKGVIKCFTSR